LCIDFYAVKAGKAEQLLGMRDAGFTIGRGLAGSGSEEVEQERAKTEDAKLDGGEHQGYHLAEGTCGGDWTILDLPNICFSCSLAQKLSAKAEEQLKSKDDLQEALRRFPLVLRPLVEKCRNELGSRVKQEW